MCNTELQQETKNEIHCVKQNFNKERKKHCIIQDSKEGKKHCVIYNLNEKRKTLCNTELEQGTKYIM